MKKVIVAPVGEDLDSLFVGIREFPTQKVILISPKEMYDKALEAKKNLEQFKIPTEIVEIKGDLWEGIFKEVARIRKLEENVLINVGSGDQHSRCAATSAAFVNGLKAFSVMNDEPMLLPVLKFNYYNLLSDKKMEILKIIHACPDCYSSLEELSKSLKMSIPLLSYHINGTAKSEGLKSMELVSTEEIKGKMKVSLTTLARMLLKGYLDD